MFSYYGSKSKIVGLYPPPKYSKIIEPFAGSARYSLKYFDRDILLIEKYEPLVKLWKWLQIATEKDIDNLPILKRGEKISDFNLSEGESLFLSFCVSEATTTGKLTSPFGREYYYEPRKNWAGDMVWSEPEITNQINQGLGADVMAVARVATFQRFKRYRLRSRLVNTVHDSIVSDCPDNEVQTVTEIKLEVFKDLPKLIEKAYGIPWNLPMIGEVSVGPNMSDLTEVKL